MDVGNFSSSSLLLDQAQAGADQAKLQRLESEAPTKETLAGLEKTAKDFEAVFMNTLMKAMRKTVPDNKMFNGGGATKFYRQMHDAEMAKSMATGKAGLGIADLIIQQFSQNVDAKAASEALAKAAAERQAVGIDSGSLPEPDSPLFGPPAPIAQISRYEQMSPVGEQVAKMARLRGAAKSTGTAVAGTLSRFEFELGSASVKSGVDPALLLAVVMAESGGDPAARSPKGALGLMQLMPGTAAEVGVSDATSPGQNLHGGADYLAKLMRRYDDQLDLALAAYNAGPGNVDKAGRQIPDFPETQRYVKRVTELYHKLSDGTSFANKSRMNE
ncbi:MAG: soluble lytic murein transglycosylase-like protein [Candidatus Krumholzibacteriia bacterium]|jgi:soluble lytic murein transglycosylase-like protein